MLALMPATIHTSPVDVPSTSRPRVPRKPSSSNPVASTSRTALPPISSSSMSRPKSPPPSAHRTVRSISPMATSAPGPDELADIDEVDVHAIPAPDLLKMLASLLTQIAQQNDSLLLPLKDPDVPASPLTPHPAPPEALSLTTAARHALESSQSLLTFHARNIPTITLEAYLLRILKYCPTTNEVFLSLLVYFERMGKLSREVAPHNTHPSPINGKMWSPTEGLVIDSYNVHRLVIAGVTVASKFFSDVFYTNSRYAKVGGLPQAELNQLELQFLLLNNFQLSIPHDEMQRYARELVRFGQRQDPSVPIPPEAIKKGAAAMSSVPRIQTSPLSTSGASTPPEQLRKQQEMGAIDAYGGALPERPSPVASTSGSLSHRTTSSLSGVLPTMTSHPFLPSSSSSGLSPGSSHPFLPNSGTSPSRHSHPHPFLPSHSSSSSVSSTHSHAGPSRSGHFLQPGALGFDHSQGFGYSYDDEDPSLSSASSSSSVSSSAPRSAPPHTSVFHVQQPPPAMTALLPSASNPHQHHRPRLASVSSAHSDASSLFVSESEPSSASGDDTGTEGGGSTEDETTIRPANRSHRGSICSFASSSTTSLYSDYGSTSSEVDMDEDEERGFRTPETPAGGGGAGERTPETTADAGMSSP